MALRLSNLGAPRLSAPEWRTTFLCAFLLAGEAFAAQLAGVHLDDTLHIGGEPLTLVSCGVRDTMR